MDDAVTAVEGAGGPNDKKSGRKGRGRSWRRSVFLGVAHCSTDASSRTRSQEADEHSVAKLIFPQN